MNSADSTVKFRITGTTVSVDTIEKPIPDELKQWADADDIHLYSVTSHRSGTRTAYKEARDGQHVVLLKILGGPTLVLSPTNARDLLASDTLDHAADRDSVAEKDSAVLVTSRLPWSQDAASARGGEFGAMLQWFAIIGAGAAAIRIAGHAATLAIARKLDERTAAGLFQLHRSTAPDGTEPRMTARDLGSTAWPGSAGKSVLILVHGTFVDTSATFGKLWMHADIIKALFDAFGDRVVAFDHPTLLASPVANALALASALPDNARITLATHSRGGLVAEILVRAAAGGCAPTQIDPFFDTGNGGNDRADLLALHDMVARKNITVERVVRVACPARGTLLASGRLDAYLSVFHWLLASVQNPFASIVFELLQEIALRGTSPDTLPGLAAMRPDSAVVKWLNAPITGAASRLYVIAGDCKGDSLRSWIRTLMGDAFFWTDNDLVVQTRSMYGGVPRAPASAHFRRFSEGDISHFTYFSFRKSADALREALCTASPREWSPIGPLSWEGVDPGGLRAPAEHSPDSRQLPIVFVVPDVFGSHLRGSDRTLRWLTWDSVANFGDLAPDPGRPLTPDGLVAGRYGKLCERLAETHSVTAFPYDWRLPLEVEAKRLAGQLETLLDTLPAYPGPIRFVAHGMGGLLLRVMQVQDRKLWTRIMARPGARVLMLGVPQRGMWLPLQILSGDETLGHVLDSVGPLLTDSVIRSTLAKMPGFMQLQSGMTDPELDLSSEAGWKMLQARQTHAETARTRWHQKSSRWEIPSASVLAQASKLWNKLDHALPEMSAEGDKIVLVTGRGHSTPSGITVHQGDVMLDWTVDGDGRVTQSSAYLPGSRIWRLDIAHGELPSTLSAFGAYTDLLADGTTGQLRNAENIPIDADDDAAVERSAVAQRRPLRHRETMDPPAGLHALFEVRLHDMQDVRRTDCIAVSVRHGDLRFIRTPLLLGHYQSMSLTGSEAVVDKLVGARMSKALRAGIYPDLVGTHQIFENGRYPGHGRQKERFIPRPRAAIVVGLGEEGKLNAQRLSFTIRGGILALAERLAEDPEPAQFIHISATLIGSGGTGITTGDAALALMQAIKDANPKLKEAGWAQVDRLEIVELYLDRATDAWRVLKLHADANPGSLELDKVLMPGVGSLRRPLDSSYRGATYDFIRVLQSDPARAHATRAGHPDIVYSLDTKRARTEVRAQRAQGTLVHDLVEKASNASGTDPLIGRTLFKLLVPVEIEPYLIGKTDMLMELDSYTAALPWELLETDPDPAGRDLHTQLAPWAVRCRLIRKLQTPDYRMQVVDASVDDNVLIIGEPKIDDDKNFGRLPGAQQEALSIEKTARRVLGSATDKLTVLANRNDAHTIINHLFARNYRIVHIAGHGASGGEKGVVLSGAHTYLGTNEIRAMRVTPELVFINCCYSAHRGSPPVYDRVAFAASLADALIQIGVRCVVAAGWAIGDKPAERFANRFYSALFNGERFIDAVGAGRRAAWEADRAGNTWAAYQCYGDPDWRFRANIGAWFSPEDQASVEVTSPSTLVLYLQSIRNEALYTARNAADRERLAKLLSKLANISTEWSGSGEVAEAFGHAYAALPDRREAIGWFNKARSASDGAASLLAVQMLAEQKCLPGADESELKQAIKCLKRLSTAVGPNLRRMGLMGTAHKRLSRLLYDRGPEHHPVASAHLEQAIKAFDEATRLPTPDIYDFYPLRALLECRLRKEMIEKDDHIPAQWQQIELAEVTRKINIAAHQHPEFWSIVAQTQVVIMQAIIQRRLGQTLREITRSFADLHNRIATEWYWSYVYDDSCFLLEPYLNNLRVDQSEHDAASELLKALLEYSNCPACLTGAAASQP